MQTKLESLIEALINVLIGFVISLVVNALVLPLVGLDITLSQNLFVGIIFTLVSVARSYLLRRFCQNYLTAIKLYLVVKIHKFKR